MGGFSGELAESHKNADRLEDAIYCRDALSEEVAMSLFAAKVMIFPLLAWGAAFAQADPSALRALQTPPKPPRHTSTPQK